MFLHPIEEHKSAPHTHSWATPVVGSLKMYPVRVEYEYERTKRRTHKAIYVERHAERSIRDDAWMRIVAITTRTHGRDDILASYISSIHTIHTLAVDWCVSVFYNMPCLLWGMSISDGNQSKTGAAAAWCVKCLAPGYMYIYIFERALSWRRCGRMRWFVGGPDAARAY